jgi:hypothetical protein
LEAGRDVRLEGGVSARSRGAQCADAGRRGDEAGPGADDEPAKGELTSRYFGECHASPEVLDLRARGIVAEALAEMWRNLLFGVSSV